MDLNGEIKEFPPPQLKMLPITMPALSATPNTSFPLVVHTGLKQKLKAQKCLSRTLNLKKYSMLDINCNRDNKNYVSSDQAHPTNVYSLEHGF